MFFVLFLIVALLFVWYFLIKPLTFWSDKGVKQTRPWIPFGDFFEIIFGKIGFPDFLANVYNLYPNARYVGFYAFTTPILCIRDPALVKQLTIKDFDYFTDHAKLVDPDADPMLAKSILCLKGQKWKEMRSIVTPSFTGSKMKEFYVFMAETAENVVKYFDQNEENIVEMNIKDAINRYTNDVIATTAFGLKVDSLQKSKNTFYEMGRQLTNVRGAKKAIIFMLNRGCPIIAKYLKLPLYDVEAAKYFYNVIEGTIKLRKEKNIVRPDLVHLLLESRKQQNNNGKSNETMEISNMDIAAQAAIFFFAGFDTVSAGLSFATYELVVNPDVQTKLRTEINRCIEKRNVDYETLQNISYLDMVVCETLRKWPPFPSTDRVCSKPYTLEPEPGKDEVPIKIATNQQIWIDIFGLHRDPKYFPDPEKFDPERFSEENKEKLVPYSYLPFGVGPRTCIGNRFALLEMKVLLFNLVLNYELVPTKNTTIPMVLSKDFNLTARDGFWLGLRRIEQK